MQLSLMNKVKRGEMSIDDALNQARMDREQLLKQRSFEELQEQKPSQYNFSVHKHGRYRWQKRVIQFDFKTKMLCSIEKGIVKRQLSFSDVKSCHDGAGSRFSIAFRDHHDYELEATSLEDKHKMMQLVNEIIYGNIYSNEEEGNAETSEESTASKSVREGILLLHRGGLASFRWVKYNVQLLQSQLILVPFKRRGPTEGEGTSSVPMPTVIHLSDGDTSVQKPQSPDTFSLTTHKNEYHFRVPPPEQPNDPGSVQRERDAWMQAIGKLCSEWKRKSSGEHVFADKMTLRNNIITVEEEHTEKKVSNGQGGQDANGDISETASSDKPVPKPRNLVNSPSVTQPDDVLPRPSPPPVSPRVVPLFKPDSPLLSPGHAMLPATPGSPGSPLSPTRVEPQSPISVLPQPPTHDLSQSSTLVFPPSPILLPFKVPPAPAPPPLPIKSKTIKKNIQTKAFHWDVVSPDKISKSFWVQDSSRKIEIDTSRLYEHFAVKNLGTVGVTEHSNSQNIMLNQKIAHTFGIFLKSFPVRPGELKDKLFIVNEEDGGLSDGHITSLRRYVPTIGDVEKYTSYKGPVTELHIVDQYMKEMCNIPYLSSQLDLLLTLRELPISMNDLRPLINQKITMCRQLYNSRSFVSVLEYLLAIGNYLNENARKEKAKGFRLSTLTKVSQLRGGDKKFTLLDALVEQIMLHEPSLVTFTQELAEFETVPGASIKGLTAEVDVLKNELQKIIMYRKTAKKRNVRDTYPNFLKDLKTAIEKYKADLSALTKTCEEMKKLYSVILVKFGEAADLDSQELFGVICQFIHDFKRAHAETV